MNDSTDIMNAISSVTGRFSQTPYGMPDIRAAFVVAFGVVFDVAFDVLL